MKESLFDILNSHPNWQADIMEPVTNIEACAALDKEIKQAAAMYADSLLPLADRWQKAVENDINQISTTEPPHTHFNKDRQKRYILTVDYFIGAVKQALKDHGLDISQLDRVTQWRLKENVGGWPGSNTQIEDGLTKDEADRLLLKMSKQGFRAQSFRELCSNLYTVLAYKVEASQTMPPNTQSDTPPAAGQMGEVWQEQETPTKLKRKRGRPQKEFEDFFITPDDAPKVISILEKLLKKKFGRDAARIIVACYHGGWITEPTPASIERKFGIEASGLKEPLRCHFAPPAHSNPKFPKFTNEELSPIVKKIQLKLASTPQQ